VVSSFAAELMTWPLKSTDAGQIATKNLEADELSQFTAGKTVLAIGPGLGQSAETVKFTTGLLSATQMPAVIDADALNILAAKPVLLAKLAKGRTLVLTPHPGEMARLAGCTVTEVQADRLNVARSFAERMGVILVLKGARTPMAAWTSTPAAIPAWLKAAAATCSPASSLACLHNTLPIPRTPLRPRSICTGWPRIWRCAIAMSTPCWLPIAWRNCREPTNRACMVLKWAAKTGMFGCRGALHAAVEARMQPT
jgi:hypothetical protein